MKIIKKVSVFFLFALLANLHHAFSMTEGLRAHNLQKPTQYSGIDHDETLSGNVRSSKTAIPASSKYNPDEVVNEIQKSNKNFYNKNSLSVSGIVFESIKKGNKTMISKFKEALKKITIPDPDKRGPFWDCSAEYYPETEELYIVISDPV